MLINGYLVLIKVLIFMQNLHTFSAQRRRWLYKLVAIYLKKKELHGMQNLHIIEYEQLS